MQSNIKNVYNSWAELMSDDEDIAISTAAIDSAIDSGFVQVRSKKERKNKTEKVEDITSQLVVYSKGPGSVVSNAVSNASETYKCTKMCNSVLSGEDCKWKDNCTYAHKVEELRLSPCHFGMKCNNIICPVLESDVYVNNPKGSRVCTFIHPEERLDEYSARVFNLKKPVEIVPVKKEVTTIKKEVKVPELPKASVQNKWLNAVPFVPKLVLQEPVEKPEGEKIILDVPEKLAMQALEMAIKSGVTNIEVRIH